MSSRTVLFVAWATVCSCGHGGVSDGFAVDGGPAPGSSPPGARASGMVLRGGSIVDPSKQTIVVGDLTICGGVVVDAAGAQGCSLTQVDVTGKWIIPSLRDMHVHARGISLGNGGFQPIAIEDEASLFRVAGVTAFLDAMNDEAKIFPARDAQRAQASVRGADIFCSGGAFTPTGGHGTEYGLPPTSYRIVDTVQEVATQMADLETKNPDVVKIMYDHRGIDGGPDVADGQQGELGVAMSQEVMQALVSTANEKHMRTEVHIGVWNDARSAIEAGATLIAHLGEPAIPDDVLQLAKQKGVYWMPTQSLYHGLTDIIAAPSLLDDPLLQTVASPADIDTYQSGQLNVDPYTMAWYARHTLDAANVSALKRAGIRLLAGTDVVELGMFVGWSLHRELVLFVQAGLSPWEALATATINAGQFLGKDYGIEPGAEGSVLVLDASPIEDIWNTTKIRMVVHHGQIVQTK